MLRSTGSAVAAVGIILAAVGFGPASAADHARSPELAMGLLAHGVDVLGPRADGRIREGSEENHTRDIELLYRSRSFAGLWQPNLVLKAEINLNDRTHFLTVGSEWQHRLSGQLFGRIGIGLTYQTGYTHIRLPDENTATTAQMNAALATYRTRTEFGSRILFNPNVALGWALSPRWSAEIALEHYSHARLLSRQNPGINNIGLRIARRL